jgi:hypothetical protein
MPEGLKGIAIRLVVAWLLLSAAGFWQGAELLRWCVPLFASIARLITPELASHVEILGEGPTAQILLDARVARPIWFDDTRGVGTGMPLPSRVNAVHALVPLVILWTALLAVPAHGVRERMLALVLAIPVSAAVLAATTPFHLVGLIELSIQSYAKSLGIERSPPFALSWMIFLEGGGRWLLPLAGALLTAQLAHRPVPHTAGENAS